MCMSLKKRYVAREATTTPVHVCGPVLSTNLPPGHLLTRRLGRSLPGREAERPGHAAKSGCTVHQPLLLHAAAEPPQLCKPCQRGPPALGPAASEKGQDGDGKSPRVPTGCACEPPSPPFLGFSFPTTVIFSPFFSSLACKNKVTPRAPSQAWCARVGALAAAMAGLPLGPLAGRGFRAGRRCPL